MATIVTRAGKGSPLTHTEVDANFTNLNDEAATKAPLASPALTGTPTAPTASLGTNTTQVATTAFVNAEIANDITGKADLASPAFTGVPTAPTASVGTNTTQVATTAFVNAEIANDITGKADLASPAFTGVPTAPTATVGTNTTQVATTAFVIANAGSLNSPAFTGTPTAPTASVGTDTTQLATTAFVNAEIANDAPTKTGGGASGTWNISISGNAATATSATDSTKLPLSGGTLTGTTTILNSSPVFVLRDSDSTGASQVGWISFQDNGGTERAWFGYGSSGNTDLNISNSQGAVTIQGSVALHAGNYTSYSPSLTGSGASGTWGININGTFNSSARSYSREWIEMPNHTGLYSPLNGAHFYPNNGSYGAWKIDGSRNGWGGVEFSGGVSLMQAQDGNNSGFHNNGYGWQFYWSSGSLVCFKNTYGGGTGATVLDSVNFGGILAGIGAGNVGSYAYCTRAGNSSTYTIGSTIGGGDLRYSSASGLNSGTPGGTWRCMGYVTGTPNSVNTTSLWLRIS